MRRVPGRATRVFRYATGGFHLSRNGIARDLSINKRICGRGNYLYIYTYYDGTKRRAEEVRQRRMRKLTTIGLLIGRRAKDTRGGGRGKRATSVAGPKAITLFYTITARILSLFSVRRPITPRSFSFYLGLFQRRVHTHRISSSLANFLQTSPSPPPPHPRSPRILGDF